MQVPGQSALRRLILPAAVLFACGCGQSPMGMLLTQPTLIARPAPGPVRAPAGTVTTQRTPTPNHAVGQGHATASHGVTPAGAASGPAPVLPLNLTPPESPQDAISLLHQRLAANDDERKTLAARLVQVEMLLQEKEKALEEAREEIGNASSEITQARGEIRRYRQVSDEMRDKLRQCEKENRELLERSIKILEKCAPEGDRLPLPSR